MTRLQIIIFAMVMMIPKVLPIPFPQQSSTSDSPFLPTDDKPDNDNVVAEPGRKNNILYWVFGIIGIAVFVEIIYWIFRCIHLLRSGIRRNDNDNNIQNFNGNYINNLPVNRRRDLFDIPSYAGSIDEELPPYEGFSLPKYHHIINENISSNGGDQGSIASPQETIQMVELDSNSNNNESQSQLSIEPPLPPPPPSPPPSSPSPPQPVHAVPERPS